MIGMLLPSVEGSPSKPITLEIGDVKNYNFTTSALQILQILGVLEATKLIKKTPTIKTIDDVLLIIQELIDDIDLGSDELQISELKHIRIEYRDELLSLEVFIGV